MPKKQAEAPVPMPVLSDADKLNKMTELKALIHQIKELQDKQKELQIQLFS